jgi:threonine 3-dehydrogenase
MHGRYRVRRLRSRELGWAETCPRSAIAALSPTAQAIADHVASALPKGADFTFQPDPKRQRILDSWPAVLDDTNARRDWGWGNRYDLAAMTQELLPQIRELLATRADALGPSP